MSNEVDLYAPILGMKARLYTPQYHREIAALHALPCDACKDCNGKMHRCLCESCELARDEARENAKPGQLGLFGAA